MNVKDKVLKALNFVEDLFMTNHSCVCCGREIVDGTKFQVCENCKNKFDLLNDSLCEKCGDRVAETVAVCDNCKKLEYHFDQNRSYAYYNEVTASVVKGLKYNKKKYFARHIAEMMCEIKDFFDDVDMISYVPISNKRRKERGFNQAEEIAKELGKLLKLPVENLLVKVENKKHQAELSQQERLKNLIGSFVVCDDSKQKIKNKVVLIVDDVFTTGATLSECAKVLERVATCKIKTVTFAKTKFNNLS